MKFSFSSLSPKNLGRFLKKKKAHDPAVLSFHKERDWVLLIIFFFVFLVGIFLGHGFLYTRYLKIPPTPVAVDAGVNLKKDKFIYDKAYSWIKERAKKYEEAKTMLVPQDPSL